MGSQPTVATQGIKALVSLVDFLADSRGPQADRVARRETFREFCKPAAQQRTTGH